MADQQGRIQVFLRVRPSPEDTGASRIELGPDGRGAVCLRPAATRSSDHQSEQYAFSFDGLFGEAADQEQVFEAVAAPVVRAAVQGINGTVFAYGQTGSGKTYTLSGSALAYAKRGILPRAISLLHAEIAGCSKRKFQVHVSYMEVYNEVGYDLLDTDRVVHSLADLPQVILLEDGEGLFQCRNLSRHWVSSAEEAFNLLFLGATNRTISETPLNKASSRSHCIFTVYVESREDGADTIRTSRLNLVDLAGSERVYRSRIDGITLHEAKHINLSLHHLEQVIVALQAQAESGLPAHVPYRNSLLTMVLRDCLGGRCKTCMIATVTGQAAHFEETLSTCRFSQRVACIPFQAVVNDHISPELVIANLRARIAELEAELWCLRRTDDIVSEAEQHAYCAELLHFVEMPVGQGEPPLRLHPQLLLPALQHLRQAWQSKDPVAVSLARVEKAAHAEPMQLGAPEEQPQEDAGLDTEMARRALERKQEEAADLLAEVNIAQSRLQGLRAAVEKKRLHAMLFPSSVPDNGSAGPGSMLAELTEIDEVKAVYKGLLARLNETKAAILYMERAARPEAVA